MEITTGGETNVVNENKENIEIKLFNSGSSFWWKDLKITINGKKHIALEAKLDVTTNYALMQKIDAYHSYVTYHDNLVKAVYNKPLSVASLNTVNEDGILQYIEILEKDLILYRNAIIHLENVIIDEIISHRENGKLLTIEDNFSYRFNKFFGLFKFSKHNNVLEHSLNITYEENKLKIGK